MMPSPARTPACSAFALILGLTLLVAAGAPAAAESTPGRVVPAHPASSAEPSQDAYNRDVRIHNQTGWSMTYLYASSGGDWSDDLLGSDTLEPGQSLVVTIDDGSGACRYSLKAEFDNGQSLQRNGVNACEVADYYFTR